MNKTQPLNKKTTRSFHLCISVLSLLFISPVIVNAQSVRVSGQVLDEESNKVPFASVMLLDKESRTVVKSAYTSPQGEFSILSDKDFPMTLKVEHVLYDSCYVSLLFPCDTVLIVRLKAAAINLDDVTIVARRESFIYRDDGNVVVNAANIPGYDTDNTSELLRKLPGVFVDETNKRVLLNGMSIELQMDGKKMQANMMALLKAMPAVVLDQVELISNKTAQYDGDADAVINLTTKRKRRFDGYFGNIEADLARRRKDIYTGYGEAFFMLMKNRFYLQQAVMIEPQHFRGGSASERTYYGDTGEYIIRQTSGTEERSSRVGTNTNLSWITGKGHSLSINIYFSKKSSNYVEPGQKYSSEDGLMIFSNDGKFKTTQISGNVEFETSDSLKYKLKVSYGYVGSWYRNDLVQENIYETGLDETYYYNSEENGYQNIVKMDFRKKLFNKLNFRAGMKGDFGHAVADNKYEPETSSRKNALFDYNENVISVYTSFSGNPAKKLAAYIGVRAEYTFYMLDYKSESVRGRNDYWNILPSASITYTASRKYQTSLQLVSSVSRPDYNMLMPNAIYYDDNNYSSGNPYLRPSRSYSLALVNRFFSRVSLTIGGRVRYDIYGHVLLDEGNDITHSTYMNCMDYVGGYVSLSAPLQFFNNKLYINLNTTYRIGKYINPSNGFTFPAGRGKARDFSASADISYNITDRLRVSSSFNYTGSQKGLQTDTKENFYFSPATRYSFLKDKNLNLTMRFTDLLNSRGKRYTTTYYNNNVRIENTAHNFQTIWLELSYNFRGGKDFKRGQKQTDSNAEDKRFE